MKKIFPIIALLFAFATHAQTTVRTPIDSLAKAIQNSIPYHDSIGRFTITSFSHNPEYLYIQLMLRAEPDFNTPIDSCEVVLARLFHDTDKWDLRDLLPADYSLRFNIFMPKPATGKYVEGTVGGAYSFSNHELHMFVANLEGKDCRDTIATIARQMNDSLPHATAQGEVWKECRFEHKENQHLWVYTYEYEAEAWPEIKDYLTDNEEQVRQNHVFPFLKYWHKVIRNMVCGNVTLSYAFCPKGGDEVVYVNIEPWMWEVYAKKAGIELKL